MKRLVALLSILILAGPLQAQTAKPLTVSLRIDCPPMAIRKVGLGLWRCDQEVMQASITWPGQQRALKASLKRIHPEFPETIPPTFVRKRLVGRMVDPCTAVGTMDNGSVLTLHLPEERVTLKRGLMTAHAITATGTLVEKDNFRFNGFDWVMQPGRVWRAMVHFPECPTDPVGLGLRVRIARQIVATGELVYP